MKPYGGHKEKMKCGCQNHPGKHTKCKKKTTRQESKKFISHEKALNYFSRLKDKWTKKK